MGFHRKTDSFAIGQVGSQRVKGSILYLRCFDYTECRNGATSRIRKRQVEETEQNYSSEYKAIFSVPK